LESPNWTSNLTFANWDSAFGYAILTGAILATFREAKKPEYLAINPVGKVPALIDDGVIVHDSTIIKKYLEDKFPHDNLLRQIPLRERVRGSSRTMLTHT
jgi:glutathione S-transferase